MSDVIIGSLNTLQAVKTHSSGILLDGGELGEILLPNRYVPAEFEPGEEIEVFISNDSEDRLVATTEKPFAMADEFALLEVVAASRVGAFLDWGMPKDLLLPFGEQARRLKVGDKELVYIYVDEVTNRLVASAKLGKFIGKTAPDYLQPGNRVSLILAERTDIGFKTIVNDSFWGMIHTTESKGIPRRGERCNGFVARIREDGLIDVTLHPPGYARVTDATEQLAEQLARIDGGFLALHDKSPPEAIRDQLGMSKKVFKQAIGALYRDGRVKLSEGGIQWLGKKD